MSRDPVPRMADPQRVGGVRISSSPVCGRLVVRGSQVLQGGSTPACSLRNRIAGQHQQERVWEHQLWTNCCCQVSSWYFYFILRQVDVVRGSELL